MIHRFGYWLEVPFRRCILLWARGILLLVPLFVLFYIEPAGLDIAQRIFLLLASRLCLL
jgi:hypothetical protein